MGQPIMNRPGNGQPSWPTVVDQKPNALAVQPTAETAGMVLAAQAEALVKARYWIACAKPRDLDAVRQKMLKECERPSFAKGAIYHKPIGKGVEGPSIRFAEAAMQALGNLLVDVPTVYDDDEKRIMRVSVLDLETNTGHSKDVCIMKRVERLRLAEGQVALRSRTNSRGQTTYLVAATDEEILNTENALVSKALRTVGLRLVPGWLIDECLAEVRKTRADADAKDPDAAKRKLFDSFEGLGIGVEQLKKYLGHDGAVLQPKEREELLGIYTAIRDGETTWREVMDAREPAKSEPASAQAPAVASKGTAGVKERLRNRYQKGPQEAKPAAASPAPAPQPTSAPAEVDEHGFDTTGDPEPEPNPGESQE
jgi:hypothetical protein